MDVKIKWIHARRNFLLVIFSRFIGLFYLYFLYLSYWAAKKLERFVDVKVNGFTLRGR